MADEGLNRGDFEQQLGGLEPRPVRLDRDWIMYLAGRESVRPGRWPLWVRQGVLATAAALASFYVGAHYARPEGVTPVAAEARPVIPSNVPGGEPAFLLLR